jgi:hypothetical protein
MKRSLSTILLILLSGIQPALPAIRINEIQSANAFTIKDEDGDRPDWIELVNSGSSPVSLAGFGISDDPARSFRWTFGDRILAPGERLVVFASGKDRRTPGAPLHLNFEIDSDGETIRLTAPSGAVADTLAAGRIPLDASFGRQPDGGDGLAYFESPTPGRPNTAGSGAPSGSVRIAPAPGFYPNGVSVSLTGAAGETVRYTTDGTDPDRSSPAADGPLRLDGSAVLKARTFRQGALAGPVSTATFLVEYPSGLAVVSIVIPPDYLFDPDIGIYVEGKSAAMGGYPGFEIGPPANYWEDWVRPGHVDFIEPDGASGFSADVGLEMHGKTSRRLPQKSFTVLFRGKWGRKELRYPLFPGLGVDVFRSFLLRNAGSDNTDNAGGVQFRDGLVARLTAGLDLDVEAYRPCAVFINGSYWGVYELRELECADYIASHHGVDPDGLDILDDYHRLDPWILEGDAETFNDLIRFLSDHDPLDGADAEFVRSRVEVDNYLCYMAVQIYLANQDGPGHNCRFWRPRTAGGRFRWLLYDADLSFGQMLFVPAVHYDPRAYEDDTIAYYLEENGPSWPNPPESTFLFRKILANPEFRDAFLNRLADLMNSVFLPDTVLARIVEVREALAPEMDRHFGRWGRPVTDWETGIETLTEFARNRPEWLRNIAVDEFGLSGTAKITVAADPPDGGSVRLNSLALSRLPWTGMYFRDVPIRLTADPSPGRRFLRWEGSEGTSDPVLDLVPRGEVRIRAVFDGAAGETGGNGPPSSFALPQNHPNPFNSETRIRWSVPVRSRIVLEIFNHRGEKLKTLVNVVRTEGEHETAWDGTGADGRPVSSGIYFCRILAGGRTRTIKMTVLR